MTAQKTGLLAAVVNVRGSSVYYPSCPTCNTKLLHDKAKQQWVCCKCGDTVVDGKLSYRYRLSMDIVHNQTKTLVTVFGKVLESFMGITANGLFRYLNYLNSEITVSTEDLLKEALKTTFLEQLFFFEFPSKVWDQGFQTSDNSCKVNISYGNCASFGIIATNMFPAHKEQRIVKLVDALQYCIKTMCYKLNDTNNCTVNLSADTELQDERNEEGFSCTWSPVATCTHTYSQPSILLSCEEASQINSSNPAVGNTQGISASSKERNASERLLENNSSSEDSEDNTFADIIDNDLSLTSGAFTPLPTEVFRDDISSNMNTTCALNTLLYLSHMENSWTRKHNRSANVCKLKESGIDINNVTQSPHSHCQSLIHTTHQSTLDFSDINIDLSHLSDVQEHYNSSINCETLGEDKINSFNVPQNNVISTCISSSIEDLDILKACDISYLNQTEKETIVKSKRQNIDFANLPSNQSSNCDIAQAKTKDIKSDKWNELEISHKSAHETMEAESVLLFSYCCETDTTYSKIEDLPVTPDSKNFSPCSQIDNKVKTKDQVKVCEKTPEKKYIYKYCNINQSKEIYTPDLFTPSPSHSPKPIRNYIKHNICQSTPLGNFYPIRQALSLEMLCEQKKSTSASNSCFNSSNSVLFSSPEVTKNPYMNGNTGEFKDVSSLLFSDDSFQI